MAKPERPETVSYLNTNTKTKFEEAMKMTGRDPQAASRLVLADSVNELLRQLYVSGVDLADEVSKLKTAIAGK